MKLLTAGTLLGLALAAGFPFASVAREDRPLFYNIVPVFPGREDFAVSEILRQHREVGLDRFLLSLSFHPQTTPARDLVPVLCERFRKVRDGVAGSGVELGVLVQSTLGHGWNGKVPLTQEKWQHVVLSTERRARVSVSSTRASAATCANASLQSPRSVRRFFSLTTTSAFASASASAPYTLPR